MAFGSLKVIFTLLIIVGLDAGDCGQVEAAAGGFVGAVLVGEHNVVSGERRAVSPHDVALERPGDFCQVVRDAVACRLE